MTDLIDRQAAIDAMAETLTDFPVGLTEAYEIAEDALSGLPSAEPERKKVKRMDEPKIIKLIQENPDLPIIPMVDAEVVADDYCYWMGKWGRCEVTEYYLGREKVHFKDDDEENVLMDLEGCGYCKDFDGNDIYDLSDEQWDALYKKVPWAKAIVVYITV